MTIQNVIKSSLAAMILFAACTPATTNNGGNTAAESGGKTWKKEVTRMISLGEQDDTVKHHLKDVVYLCLTLTSKQHVRGWV